MSGKGRQQPGMGRQRKGGEGRQSDQEVGMGAYTGIGKQKGVKTTGRRKQERNMGIIIEVMSSIIIFSV